MQRDRRFLFHAQRVFTFLFDVVPRSTCSVYLILCASRFSNAFLHARYFSNKFQTLGRDRQENKMIEFCFLIKRKGL